MSFMLEKCPKSKQKRITLFFEKVEALAAFKATGKHNLTHFVYCLRKVQIFASHINAVFRIIGIFFGGLGQSSSTLGSISPVKGIWWHQLNPAAILLRRKRVQSSSSPSVNSIYCTTASFPPLFLLITWGCDSRSRPAWRQLC